MRKGVGMNSSLLAQLNDAERLMWDETERAALAELDEDAVGELHVRVRRARNKYTGLYRRQASARVGAKGGRGAARPGNSRNAAKAEVFEEALSRVSRRLAVLSRQAAADLRAERIAAARAETSAPPTAGAASTRATRGSMAPARPRGDQALRSPRTERNRASTSAAGRRRQGRRDSR